MTTPVHSAELESGREPLGDPGRSDDWYDAGLESLQVGDVAAAIECLRKAAELYPDNALYLHGLGAACLVAGEYESAIESFERALWLEENEATRDHLRRAYSGAHITSGERLFAQGRYSEAVDAYTSAVQIEPGKASLYNNLGVAHGWCGNTRAAIDAFRRAVELDPQCMEAGSNLLLALQYPSGIAAGTIFKEHLAWAKRSLGARKPRVTRKSKGALRVGFVSQDFRGHSLAAFFEPILRATDRARVETVCYSHTARPDAVTGQFRNLSHEWREIGALDDEAAARQIQADEIDILIDLAGHTGKNRLSLFSQRAAPVQVTYLGYPGTTGHPAMDYRITDSVADTPGSTEAFHTERLVRIDPCFLCYQPQTFRDVADLPADRTGLLTFGCFNHLPKLSDGTLNTWARILERIPGSRLLLKCRSFSDARVRAAFTARASQSGIEMERLQLRPFSTSFEEHMGLYDEVDIALDPFPYNGTTTTCEALWMGVPVVTFAGSTHVSRVSASILSTVGLEELIADSEELYIEKACELSCDLPGLRRLRGGLRRRMRRSPLLDAKSFTDRLTAAFVEMAERIEAV